MRTYQGISASPGYALGPVFPVSLGVITPQRRIIEAAEIPGEIKRFREAVVSARDQIQNLVTHISAELGSDEGEILASQLLVLEDELVWDATQTVIRMERINAEAAFSRAVGNIVSRFLEMENQTFRERVNDLQDVEQRVLRAFSGNDRLTISPPSVPSIVAARNLAPSETAGLGRKNILGFVMDEGGSTSHVAILARSLGVPAVVGVRGRAGSLKAGREIAIDGVDGTLIVDPDAATRDHMQLLTRQAVVVNEKLAYLKDLPAVTPDGHTVRLAANIEVPAEVDEALARGADSVGLLRTEYLFFQHGTIPTEDDQVKVYSEIIRRMQGRSVIFRTLDVGGDKVSDYLGAKREYNPFLGWRGIRFSLANRALFKTQIKAIYRAAVRGPTKFMFPMITGVEELRQAKEVCAEALAELKARGAEHVADLDIGIMVETPSAVMIADILATECDFFSIGSNDLIQYTLAMDRGNPRVSYLYQPLHPAILRSISRVVEAAHKHGIWAGICGEMGAETRLAEVLLGLELDEISTHGVALPKIKQVIRWTELKEAKRLVGELLDLPTASAANTHLAEYIAERKRCRQNQEH